MKPIKNKKTEKRMRIKKKIRAKISGTKDMPRMAIFRSSRFIYAQLVDDVAGKTVASVSDMGLKGTKSEKAKAAGMKLAEGALAAKITKVVFDRGGFSFAGRVKALAEGAREGGLKF